jgi:hypothetical protein
MSWTTIKVSSDLRDRINAAASDEGTTASGLIDLLLERRERDARMEAFGKAFATADESYWQEFRDWDVALDDGAEAPATGSQQR